jgi:3-deoxy-D-manno-octulosonate 8-phosphate phosphatase (KDO 8-P phosphatase)
MKHLDINMIDVIIFDFDGVLTDNSVYINNAGEEWVRCNRSDGLAFDAFRKLKKPIFILSSEKNKVVSARAKKLQVKVIQSIEDKVEAIGLIMKQTNSSLDKVLYVGNDINDYNAMELCGYTACPSDSHLLIKNISETILNSPGGGGVAREIVEDVFGLNLLDILYNSK